MFVCKAWSHVASPSHNEVRTGFGISIAGCFRNIKMAKTAVGGRRSSSIAGQCNNLNSPLHQGQLRSVVGNSPIMGGDPTIGGNPTTGWYSTQHLVGILTIFTIDAI